MNGFEGVKLTDNNPFKKKKKQKYTWPPKRYYANIVGSFCGKILGNGTVLYNLCAIGEFYGAFLPQVTGKTKISNLLIKNSYFSCKSRSFPLSGVGGFIGAHDNYTLAAYNKEFESDKFNYDSEDRRIEICSCGLVDCVFEPMLGSDGVSGLLVGNMRFAEGLFSSIMIVNCHFKELPKNSDPPMSYGGLIGTFQHVHCYVPSYTTTKEAGKPVYDTIFDDRYYPYSDLVSLKYNNVYVINQDILRSGTRNLHAYAHPGWDEYFSEIYGRIGKFNPPPEKFDYETMLPDWGSNTEPYGTPEKPKHQWYCFDNTESLSGVYVNEWSYSVWPWNEEITTGYYRIGPSKKNKIFFKQKQNLSSSLLPPSSYYIKERVSDELPEATLTTEEETTSSIPEFEVNPKAVFYLRLPGETIYKPCKVYARNEVGQYVAAKDIYVKVNDEYKKSY